MLILISDCEKENPDGINVEAEIQKSMDAERIPSVVACVVRGDEIVWEGTFGFADVYLSKQANRQTLYNLESVSKLFLAITVMQLWERGMIDLEADINQYLPFDVRNPNFPDQKITPHMLLTHTSSLAWPRAEDGIPDFYHFFSYEDVPLIREWLPDYIIPGGTYYRSNVWKEFPPGEAELYSNIGTSLLALAVENISGEDYRDYCVENILEPLEMNHSGFRINLLNEELLATPYYNNNYPIQQFIYRIYPAGNLKSNIGDFSHFIMVFLNDGVYNGKRILEHQTIEKMFEIQNPASGVSLLWQNCLGDCIGHTGGGTGFRTHAEWYPDSNKGLFIFSNKYNESVSPGGRIYELVRLECSRY